MKRVLFFAATTGYQVREFAEAARALDIELVLATDRCHILDNPWGDDAAPVRFEDPEPGIESLAARGPFDGSLRWRSARIRCGPSSGKARASVFTPPGQRGPLPTSF